MRASSTTPAAAEPVTSSTGRARSPWLRWHNWLVACLLPAAFVVVCRCWPHVPLSAFAPTSIAVVDSDGRLLRLTLSRDDKYRLWAPLGTIPRDLVDAVQLHEDRWFRWHPGFNPVSLARGAAVTYLRGGHRQGGSTLTMQLVRLLHGDSTRTPGGKALQVLRAVWLELRYSKDDILEAYLNLAPYGGNIEGVAAASRVYFDKPVARLTLPEMLTLAVLPQDPSARARPDVSGAALIGDKLKAARDRLFARWEKGHGVDAAERALFALPLRLRPATALPFRAPHAVEQMLAEAHSDPATPAEIRSTIDLRLQRVLERQVGDYLAQRRSNGLVNAAAMLVDTRDMGVKAMLGSADYFDAAIAGQVNGTTAKRSPGSTLKPFIYALALDQGVLHPLTILRDVPTSFGPFTPENFDGRFLGPVSATDALIRSRNIPAVYVASKLSKPSLYDFLKAAGISHLATEQHYGLALVLGGGEVTMQELATLYAMLANHGQLQPLRLRDDEPRVGGTRLLSDAASFVALDMLRHNPRPDDAGVAPSSSRLPVAWKTGTSWSFRDAWTAGTFGPYVLVVWLGNFDGASNPSLIGVEAAAPLFFRIVDAIKAEHADLAEPAWRIPAGVRRVEVCLASGDLPNAWCPRRGETWFLPGKSPIRVSSVHRLVHVDTRSGRIACPPYDPAHTRDAVLEYWPSDLAKVFRDAGLPRAKPPAPGDCDALVDGDPPHITSPISGATYTLRRDDATQRIAFNATVDGSVRMLYWFVDDAYVGAAKSGDALYWNADADGRHHVRAVDDQGRVDVRELRVARIE